MKTFALKSRKVATMKTLMKRKRRSKIARGRMAKAMVMRGTKEKTVGGLTRMDLKRNKRGKIVSKKASAHGANMYKFVEEWVKAFMEARADLGTAGFLAINGKSQQGKALYTKALAVYARRHAFPMAPRLRPRSEKELQSLKASLQGKSIDTKQSNTKQSTLAKKSWKDLD
mmetsp:Transcript_68989/g.127121  ORF Transcript_68989/g.127121 Transcript_68989/m.127121 type:complete len:171 (+) Transcript_68989:117-629(+)